jgi:PilZ domain
MDEERILLELRQLLGQQQEVELMSFYQSLPLIYRGVIFDVDKEEVTLIVQPPDSVCLSWDTQVYLLGPEPIDLLRADVVSFDVVSGTVKVRNFRYGGPNLGKRMITRVCPSEELKVDVETGDSAFSAAMFDISSQGLGMKLQADDENVSLEKGQEVHMNMHLPEQKVTAQATVTVVVASGDEQHISIVFKEESMDIRPVWHYVSHRRMEILQELQEKYLAAYMKGASG